MSDGGLSLDLFDELIASAEKGSEDDLYLVKCPSCESVVMVRMGDKCPNGCDRVFRLRERDTGLKNWSGV